MWAWAQPIICSGSNDQFKICLNLLAITLRNQEILFQRPRIFKTFYTSECGDSPGPSNNVTLLQRYFVKRSFFYLKLVHIL